MKTKETYCVSCKKNIGNKNSSVRRIKQNRVMVVSNCTACGYKKSRFIKHEEAGRLEVHEVVYQPSAIS